MFYEWPIIDAHTHLWDVLNQKWWELIHKKWIPDRNISDRKLKTTDILDPAQWATWAEFNHDGGAPGIKKSLMEKLNAWNVWASTKRNASATLENCINSMDAAWVEYQVTLPIPPYLTFEDIQKSNNNRIIPFTGIDFSRKETDNEFANRVETQLESDVQNGAKWLKIHPILQLHCLMSNRVRIVMEIFSKYNLPMLSHSGHANYYKLRGTDAEKKQAPEYGLDIESFAELAKQFPTSPIIVGHSWINSVHEVIERLARFENIHVDTSFQGQQYIRELIAAFGEDRVMFASDWPFWARTGHVRVMQKALAWNNIIAEKVFFKNANSLMNLELDK